MPRAMALGFFDGLHLGHQALLLRAARRAAEHGMTPALFTFDRSPREYVTGVPVPLLTTPEERRAAAAALCPDAEVIAAPFDREMMTMPWQDFVELLVRRWDAGWLVAGHDFRFGYKNAGDAALLSRRAAELGLGCDVIAPVTLDGVTVSSTHIRALLERGDAENAARFLGRPFAITGPVRHGKGIGSSRLGAPTVNLVPDRRQLVPAFGVYVTRVTVGGACGGAVTNVGVRPTVDTEGDVTVESHLLDRREDLYGARCKVEFLRMLRPERRFDSLEELSRQIRRDGAQARAYLRESEGSTP